MVWLVWARLLLLAALAGLVAAYAWAHIRSRA
jgi:hypothetical protein